MTNDTETNDIKCWIYFNKTSNLTKINLWVVSKAGKGKSKWVRGSYCSEYAYAACGDDEHYWQDNERIKEFSSPPKHTVWPTGTIPISEGWREYDVTYHHHYNRDLTSR